MNLEFNSKDYGPDGFIHLIPKGSKEEKKKKSSKNPFKKGSWKHYMYKILKKWKSNKYVSDFHFMKAENLIIYRNDKVKVKAFKKVPDKELLQKIQKKYENSFVLINAGEGIYLRISIASYLKFMEIDKMEIYLHMKCKDDATDTWFDVMDDYKTIDTIFELMSFINYYRQLVHGVEDVQCAVCTFTYVKYDIRAVVLKRDGSAETYKGDFNDFLSEYKFEPLL